MVKKQYNESQITGTISNDRQTVYGTATAGSGVTDHNRLFNREKEEQHPIEAITGLRKELDDKLDSKTALPLIEEALRTKAAGLYFDAKKELARKSYWYLTSEIDPVTKMGTKDSIISGPYDLGAGGGGGGGGGVTSIVISLVDWPSTVVVGGDTKLDINWRSTIGDDHEPTGPGTIYVSVNNKQVIVKANIAQGLVNLDIGQYLTAGSNSIKVTVLDAYGTQGVKVATINAVTLELTSNFNANLNFNGTINYTYTPWGNVDKLVHFEVDGALKGTQLVKSTGEQQTYRITGLTHGSHTLQVYFTATIGESEVRSNSLFYDLVYYEVGNSTPIIVSTFNQLEQEQYIPFNIPYRVFIWNKNSADIQLLEDGVVLKELTVNFDPQSWEYKNDVPAVYRLQIKCGSVTKTFDVHIIESEIKVLPVSENLVLALSAQGRSNNEPVEERSIWRYNDIICDMINFNWSSNGWVKDTEGNTVLRLSGDARVSIPYMPFGSEFKNYGKTIELEIATSAVMNYSTSIIECLDKNRTDFFEATPSFVDEDTRPNVFIIELNQTALEAKGLPIGSIVFSYTIDGWTLNGEVVSLLDYGIKLTKKVITDEASDEYVLVGDNIRLDHSLAARGFYVTPQIAAIRSQQSSISTQYKEDDHVRLVFVVEKNTENNNKPIIWMYINGIASGAVQYPAGDSFRQLSPDIITLGSNDAVLDIYNIRIYDNNLTGKQIVNNWIADTQNAALKAQRFYRNDNFNDRNELIIEKLPHDLPYVIWDIDPLPQFKGDKRKGNGRYVDPTNSARNFTTENVEYNVQGTSSSVYPVKNIRMRPKKSDAWYDDNGDTIKKWPITYPDGIGVDYYTFKVDYASSESANNVELVRLYNDACRAANILIPPQKSGTNKDKIRVGIDGFPIVAFHQDADDIIKFCTKANFNNDKSNPDVFGFATSWDGTTYLGDESWETTNNSADEAKYKIPVTSANWTKAFESRFPDDKTPDEHVFGTKPGELDRLTAMTTWVASTYRNNATGEEIEPVTYTYTNVIPAEDGTYSEETVTKTFDHDTVEYRLTKFKAELKDWFNVDSTIFYYIFTHLFLMVDSRAKNAFPTYYTSRTPGDGGNRWFWLPYDMDTAIGINNEGKLVFDYSLEDTDTVNGADVFNGQDSVLWCNLRDMFAGEIGKMYSELRVQRLISYENVEKMFEDHQGKWSENIFNEDSKVKYVDPLKNGDNYLEMLQGAKAEQRKWWLYNRFKYFDSKYTAGDAKADMIIFRAYVPAGTPKPDIIVTPYADIYATITYANGAAGTISKRAKRNEPIIIENPFTTAEAMTDQEVHIFSASQLKSVGDLSGFRPDTVKVGNAIKLQDLKVGDGAVGYENPNLKELTLGSNTLLKSLDVRNCTNLEQTVDVSQCINLEEIYFDNTKIKGITLSDGGNLKHLHLPETLTSLVIKNQPLLTDLVLAGTDNIESLWLENIPSSSINAYELISRMKPNSAVRLIGINEVYDDPDDLVNVSKIDDLYDLLDTMAGIDSEGEVIPGPGTAQVTGNINLPRMSYADWVRLSARYPEVRINAAIIVCEVKFMNESAIHDVRNIYAGNTLTAPVDPEKAPEIAYTYSFDHWYYIEDGEQIEWTEETIINTDLTIFADFERHDREYTVIFNPLSYIITVNPNLRSVVYNTSFEAPILSNVPPNVQLIGWFDADDNLWNFNDPIQHDMTLFAHWDDAEKPVINSIQRLTYNTFEFSASDNLGLAAYAITNTAEVPEEWINIEDSPVSYTNTYTITNAGDYYVWIKDTVGKTNTEAIKITAYNISVNAAVGSTISLLEGETPFTVNYALYGTALTISSELDSHYNTLKLYVNSLLISNPTTKTVDNNLLISSTCNPNSYTVSFNLQGKGSPVQSQSIIYLKYAEEPLSQYVPGYIIEGWYREPACENKWIFETTPVLGQTILYANWVAYSEPTKVYISIPMIPLDDPDRLLKLHVKFNYSQRFANAVTVDWGDGSQPETNPAQTAEAIYLEHDYTQEYDPEVESIDYVIQIQGPSGANVGDYTLGAGLASPLLECFMGRTYDTSPIINCGYITNIEFSADVSHNMLSQYLLKGASITDLCLTPYITELPLGLYWECKKLINVEVPRSINTIRDQVFSGCSNLQTVTIANNLKEINNYVFDGCTSLQIVNIDKNASQLVHIGKCAFRSTALRSFEIPWSVQTIGWRAGSAPQSEIDSAGIFDNCQYLTSAGFYGKPDVAVKFPWEDIPNYFGWNTLTTVKFSQNMTSIGKCAFYYTRLLANDSSGILDLTSYYSLRTIGDYAFANSQAQSSILNNVKKVLLPAGITTLGKGAFHNCYSLNYLEIPASVRNIGRTICYNCWALNTVKIFTTSLLTGKIEYQEDAWFIGSNEDCVLYVRPSVMDHLVETFGSQWNYFGTIGGSIKYLEVRPLSE